MARPAALLLIRPTGSGKTPLGDLLDREGRAPAMLPLRLRRADETNRRRCPWHGGPAMVGVSTGETPVGPTVKMPVPRRMGIVAGGAGPQPDGCGIPPRRAGLRGTAGG